MIECIIKGDQQMAEFPEKLIKFCPRVVQNKHGSLGFNEDISCIPKGEPYTAHSCKHSVLSFASSDFCESHVKNFIIEHNVDFIERLGELFLTPPEDTKPAVNKSANEINDLPY